MDITKAIEPYERAKREQLKHLKEQKELLSDSLEGLSVTIRAVEDGIPIPHGDPSSVDPDSYTSNFSGNKFGAEEWSRSRAQAVATTCTHLLEHLDECEELARALRPYLDNYVSLWHMGREGLCFGATEDGTNGYYNLCVWITDPKLALPIIVKRFPELWKVFEDAEEWDEPTADFSLTVIRPLTHELSEIGAARPWGWWEK